jgi:hypothetical protein
MFRRCIVGGELVIDLGERSIVEGVEAAEVVKLDGLQLLPDGISGHFAWVPVGELRPELPN